ncbi:hypothetical protein A2643_00740 [Candidatus Nomurabacteria bacterium RIFCSPHIGHO2_01_FULL_39_220]|uniref:Uncharacterized protein n=1 Tax=Candidatus Nomurabacteria bacterium RIFCSPLOWO2_02_FULL_40_67 TaxID=1801787 RepID=A0A1F6Y4C2_9BACT|nr:MAG: hypothetical protein UU01_C0002G0069 [Parcubacteria group bacterium GW2011_GWA2_40_37]OGI62084.1 MAG: hypothetical protein A2W12_01875 [Candidatus Nomurabacteria bacterium RBG_16_40_11]OGI70299.1 MAG: hypothetical protein A2643_00740 [Candidatus Nomurabacteria bacterium RIFCSPHIGHO2_01_FULL_39_220]OGI73502.1 MAG: hypothetical protein A2W56_02340 [Candidatus Nomurabacteria bacterium RIFCSPHIGHO2_02_41_18]OGI78771.1 MAG: hypothetical protein A3C65_02270 [Candidatus Nomurabacteria bacteriu
MDIKLEEKTKNALIWIVDILNKHQIPFQISGGFAAKMHGSPRPLNDIDIDIPQDQFSKITSEVKKYITYAPGYFKDKKWNLYIMTLNYHGQEIDIGSADVKIYDNASQTWLPFATNFEKSVWKEVAGIKVPVMPKEELIFYKKFLDGEHQKVDIEALS